MDMDVLIPVEKLVRLQADIFPLITSFSLVSYTGVACIHMSLALQILLIDTHCHGDVWYHSQCPSASHLLCLLLSGIVSLSLLLFLDCDPLKSPIGCFAALLLWCLFDGSPGSVCWWGKHKGNVLFILQQSRRHSADLYHHPGINNPRPLCKVCLLISS